MIGHIFTIEFTLVFKLKKLLAAGVSARLLGALICSRALYAKNQFENLSDVCRRTFLVCCLPQGFTFRKHESLDSIVNSYVLIYRKSPEYEISVASKGSIKPIR